MDQKLIIVDITNELMKNFKDYMDKNIDTIRLLHDGDTVALEITTIETTAKNRIKETIARTDLSFIVDDPEVSEEPIFSVSNDIDDNVERFLALTPVSLINITDLFSEIAAEKIGKKFNRFGVDR